MKAVAIFDMDGLLFDTESSARLAWAEALVPHGYSPSDALFQRFIGRDMTRRHQLLVEEFGEDFPFELIKAERMRLGDQKELADGLPVKAGAAELLQELATRGLRIALATGCAEVLARRRLQQAGFARYFQRVFTSEMVAVGKPAPDIYRHALRELGVAASAALVFEDSVAGVSAATAAGIATVMVPDLEPPTAELRQRVWRILPSLVEARQQLDELLA